MRHDDELARAFKDGEAEAFGRLIERDQERLYRLAYRITNDADDALDVVQEVFVKIHRSIDGWDERASYFSWAYRITSNMAIDFLRRRGRDHKVRDRLRRDRGPALLEDGPGPDPLEAEDRARLVDKVKEAIEELPPGQRAIVALRHYEGLSLGEIAAIRGCAVGTVKSTLHQAFKKLRTLLNSELELARSLMAGSY